MTIKELIKDAAKKACKGSSEQYPQSERRFEQGALWAMRWCLERWVQATNPLSGNLTMAEMIAVIKNRPAYGELDAAAKEILPEGGK